MITHLCPPEGEALTPCCSRVLLELPWDDRVTSEPVLVTCGSEAGDMAPAWRCDVHRIVTTGDCPACDTELIGLTEEAGRG